MNVVLGKLLRGLLLPTVILTFGLAGISLGHAQDAQASRIGVRGTLCQWRCR